MKLAHRRAHLLSWCTLALLLPALLAGGVWLRASKPDSERPVRIAPP